ncbi:hypothetical protein ACFC3F_02285 [Microbacterium sp. NPDC055910]|uniref:hypothetical protein n=1 Tax=Microbacterium sp. NPDC055910 TaxID=3345659 RepID=UPI0035E03D6F
MDETTREELRMLRARAYGREADIDVDPSAQHRLEELERLARPTQRRTDTDEHVDTTDPSREDAPVVEVVPAAAESSLPSAPGDDIPPRPSLPRRTLALWIASVVVALLVGVAATVGVSGISALGGGSVRQVATLHAIDDFDWPEFVGVAGTGSAGYDDFYGLTPLRPRGGYFAGGVEQECLLVVFTEDIETGAEYPQGGMFSGCGTGAFPATLQFPVDAGLPDELRERFPEGSALQFVLDGDRVVVFSDAG